MSDEIVDEVSELSHNFKYLVDMQMKMKLYYREEWVLLPRQLLHAGCASFGVRCASYVHLWPLPSKRCRCWSLRKAHLGPLYARSYHHHRPELTSQRVKKNATCCPPESLVVSWLFSALANFGFAAGFRSIHSLEFHFEDLRSYSENFRLWLGYSDRSFEMWLPAAGCRQIPFCSLAERIRSFDHVHS